MTKEQNDMTPAAAAALLGWLAEMGADEIVAETAVDRTIAARPATAPLPPPRRAPDSGGASAEVPGLSSHAGSGAGVRQADGVGAGGCQTLDDIAAALSRFDACPLKKTATNLCFADGNPLARVMLIGEAPGRDEDIQGKPFVGKSGRLLDRMLAAAGLSRGAEDRGRAVFITNVIFWRPPGNRTPTEAETAMCKPFLLRAIELQNPEFIVCLGATPAHLLTGRSEGILKTRGKWTAANISGRSIPLLPTLHPAYLLRQPAQKRLAWRDMLSLRQALDAH